jgi:nucleoside-diphosphate-sugar epimerase
MRGRLDGGGVWILRVLVTGAGGFLGRHVVTALRRRGCQVRVLIRASTPIDGLPWAEKIDVFQSDLCSSDSLASAFKDVDVLVHLAARMSGNESAQMADTVLGTERLLEAMSRSATRRLVLASSFSVYGWSAVRGTLTEESPLETDLDQRDAYAIAKTMQERTVRQISQEHNWDLTILRPGFIWGRDHEYVAGLGQKLGRWYFVFGPSTRVPLTYVENCADCFAEVVENTQAIGETFNVVDGHDISTWDYLGESIRRSGAREHRIPVPYGLALAVARLADLINRRVCQGKIKLPGLLIPSRLQARFKPVRFSTLKLRDRLGWQPPFNFIQCLQRSSEVPGLLSDPPPIQENHPPELHNV